MKVEILSESRTLDAYLKVDRALLRHETFSGKMSERFERWAVVRPDAVAAVVFNVDTQKLIFVKQFRYPAYKRGEPWVLELVAGLIDGGETPKQALERELGEEIGYCSKSTRYITNVFSSPGYSTERLVLYYVEVDDSCCTGRGGGLDAEHEDVELAEFGKEDVQEMLTSGAIHDMKTFAGLQWFFGVLRG